MSKKSWMIDRRTLLRGAGAAVALPLLDAMLPARASAQAMSPTRMCVIKFPLGLHPDCWKTTGSGTSYTVAPQLQKLVNENKAELTLLKGLHTHLNISNDVQAGVPTLNYYSFGVSHYQGTAGLLTCRPIARGTAYPVNVGTSFDQLVAQSNLGAQTRFRSLVLRSVENNAGSDVTYGMAKAYRTNISWANPTTPATSTDDPVALFNKLFTGAPPPPPPPPPVDAGVRDAGAPDPSIGRSGRYDVSVLDAVNEDAKRLSARLGRSDRARLDEYLTSLAEVERQAKLAAAAQQPMPMPMMGADAGTMVMTPQGPLCVPPTSPPGGSFGYPNYAKERMRAMFDLLILAFQCDLTRVATYMIDEDFQPLNTTVLVPNTLTYPHALSHYTTNEGADPALKPAQFKQYVQFYFDELSTFLNKLKAIQTPTGRLIDSMMIAFGSGISDTNSHSGYDVPVVIAGKGNGAFHPGRLADVRTGAYAVLEKERPWEADSAMRPKGRPLADLWLTMMQAMGMSTTSFGNSVGTLSEV